MECRKGVELVWTGFEMESANRKGWSYFHSLVSSKSAKEELNRSSESFSRRHLVAGAIQFNHF